MKIKRSEAQEQVAVVQYCDLRRLPIFAIPNGGSRNKIEAANLKRQGVKAGVPDLMLPVAKHGYHGLFVEMKVGYNKPTENQKKWIEILKNNGYLVKTCWGAEETINLITDYMYLEEEKEKPFDADDE